jgi:hypothetical protein
MMCEAVQKGMKSGVKETAGLKCLCRLTALKKILEAKIAGGK